MFLDAFLDREPPLPGWLRYLLALAGALLVVTASIVLAWVG